MSKQDELDRLAADPWLRELVIASGGRPPSPRAEVRDMRLIRWRRRYLRALSRWSTGRRAKAIALFSECAAMASRMDGEGLSDVEAGFVRYVESRFRCVAHDDCLSHEMMAHDCWLEEPERAR